MAEKKPQRSNAEVWLDTYTGYYQADASKLLHCLSVTLIIIGIVGLLWSLPVAQAFGRISPALNWGTTFLLAAVVYYFILSIPLALGLLPGVLGVVVAVAWLDSLPRPLWLISVGLLLAGWAVTSVGHRLSGTHQKPFNDLQLVMIGPAWLLAALFRRIGIPY